jgi:predicted regulator of Ras-like GTPase activity (Roadblock/LC7/MglB family)
MARAKQSKQIKQVKGKDKFLVAVEYLTEYTGVRGAIIADSEGMVIVSHGGSSFDADYYAALSLDIFETVKAPLRRLFEPEVEFLSIKTPVDWLTLAWSEPLILIVAAQRQADDLLNIRISRSLEMIAANVKEKYPILLNTKPANSKNEKSLEEIHV